MMAHRRPSRIILLDPDSGTVKALAEQLRQGGLDIVIAPTLKIAHKAAGEADVVIANITHTPDGPALCRALRTESGTGSLPLLALSEVELSDTQLGEILSAGAMGATWVALFSGIQNHWVMMVAMFFAAFFCGGLWAGVFHQGRPFPRGQRRLPEHPGL